MGKIKQLKIDVFDIEYFLNERWAINRLDASKYHSGGYELISPDRKYTIKHTIDVSGGYTIKYDCTINDMPIWTNTALTKKLKNFLNQLGKTEHRLRSE
mgnify:CR=1 FL=1